MLNLKCTEDEIYRIGIYRYRQTHKMPRRYIVAIVAGAVITFVAMGLVNKFISQDNIGFNLLCGAPFLFSLLGVVKWDSELKRQGQLFLEWQQDINNGNGGPDSNHGGKEYTEKFQKGIR